MLIAADDVDEFVDVSDRARAASLLPDAGPGWCNEDLLEFEPGALMIRYLSLLDVDSLDEASASVALTLWERQQAWMAERAVALTARLAGPTPPPPDLDSTDPVGRDSIDGGANLVAATLGMTTGGAQARVDTARAITETLPKCRLAMAAGFMGYWHARVVAQAARDAGLGADATAAVDARVASRSRGKVGRRFGARCAARSWPRTPMGCWPNTRRRCGTGGWTRSTCSMR